MQHLGIISVGILAIGLALVPIVWPYGVKHTFSQHVARRRASIIYYILLFSLFLPVFMTFFIGWFVPHLQLPQIVAVLALFVAATQYGCTLIPETDGWRRRWHRLLAGGSAFALMPIVLVLLFTPYPVVQVTAACSLAIMIAMPVLFLHPRFQLLGESYVIQIIYYVAFFVPVMVGTYWVR